ncbi:lamin tail domain-containing protein [Pseudenhygromyxa sp. WMMC2535]|uniref:lamin tail domain-containing protein n=1 Tax=Pseudenhygromyxa sp. WMMC2535 TaxID=2712867 RepID=UPI0015561E60|nr:lamin tail domain-containing protein [Pseudenhygromyxa sp. WMMC2535]NVB42079.1 lamin tail domain-containing protein [Pseudenhygromyxa sp. WMMC2535]
MRHHASPSHLHTCPQRIRHRNIWPRGLKGPALLTLGLALVACVEAPELEAWDPAPPDLGAVDTWGPLEPVVGLEPGEADAATPWLDEGGHLPEPDAEEDPPDPALAQLRITEALVDPEGKDGGADSPEFVELFNPGPDPVPLAGFALAALSWPELDATDLGLAELSLDPGDLLVIQRWAKDVDPSLAEPRIEDGVIFTGFLHASGLRNADGEIALPSADALPHDRLVYGAAPATSEGWLGAPLATPGSGESMCRLAPATDSDRAEDWGACTPAAGVLEPLPLDQAGDSDVGDPGDLGDEGGASDEGEEVPPAAVPFTALQIVEVHADPPGPASSEKAWEYVEILNRSTEPVDLADCWIADADSFDAPGTDPLIYREGEGGCDPETCLAPGRRALIVADGYLGEVGEALVLRTDDSTIADGGLTTLEPVSLWDGLGELVSSYRLWEDPQAEPLVTDEQPLHRVDPGAEDLPSAWVVAPASPGLP